MRNRPVVPAVLVVVLAAGCLQHLPPGEKPRYREPSVELPIDPPEPGMGRVLIETDDDPAIAELILGHGLYAGSRGGFAASVAARRLCTTPCAVDLPLGEHEVLVRVEGSSKFGRIVVRAETRPALVLVTLGEQTFEPLLTGAGYLLITGAVVGGFESALADEPRLLIPTAVVAALGGLATYAGRPTYRASSYAQYTIETALDGSRTQRP